MTVFDLKVKDKRNSNSAQILNNLKINKKSYNETESFFLFAQKENIIYIYLWTRGYPIKMCVNLSQVLGEAVRFYSLQILGIQHL